MRGPCPATHASAHRQPALPHPSHHGCPPGHAPLAEALHHRREAVHLFRRHHRCPAPRSHHQRLAQARPAAAGCAPRAVLGMGKRRSQRGSSSRVGRLELLDRHRLRSTPEWLHHERAHLVLGHIRVAGLQSGRAGDEAVWLPTWFAQQCICSLCPGLTTIQPLTRSYDTPARQGGQANSACPTAWH